MSEFESPSEYRVSDVDESEVVDILKDKEGKRETAFRTLGVAKVSTLKSIVEELDYEVSFIVSSDKQSTVFLPGTKVEATNNADMEKFGLVERTSEGHNHPSDKPPSLSDLDTPFNDGTPRYIVSKTGVTEFRFPFKKTSVEAFFNYVNNDSEDIDYLPEGVTQESLEKESSDFFHSFPGFEKESDELKSDQIGKKVSMLKYRHFRNYIYDNEDTDDYQEVYANFLDKYQLINKVDWEDEETISKILRGQSTFEN